tara:strand:- start:24195 stop:25109 length:915 start_codon:yes stop_codon:yes gene_type:complete
MIRSLCLSVLAAALFAAAPANAQSRRETTERIDAVEVRVGQLEARSMTGDPVVDTLMQRLDALDYQVRELTGETERLAFENRQLRQEMDRLQQQSRAYPAPAGEGANPAGFEPDSEAGALVPDNEAAAWMREGLDEGNPSTGDNVAIVNPDDPFAERRAAATGVLGGGTGAQPQPAVDPAARYENARAMLLDGDFDGAQDGFESFVQDHPDDARASEAWYWLGETFFVRNNYADAADAYIASLRSKADGERAPDALVRLAASLHGLGQTQNACDTLARFGREFPNASAASRDRAARESVRAGCR